MKNRRTLSAWRSGAALFLTSGALLAAALPSLLRGAPAPVAGFAVILSLAWLGIGTACLAAALPERPR